MNQHGFRFGLWKQRKPRKASILICKIRSCVVKSDLKNKLFSAEFVFILKIQSYNARSDLKIRSLASLGNNTTDWEPLGPDEFKNPSRHYIFLSVG